MERRSRLIRIQAIPNSGRSWRRTAVLEGSFLLMYIATPPDLLSCGLEVQTTGLKPGISGMGSVGLCPVCEKVRISIPSKSRIIDSLRLRTLRAPRIFQPMMRS